MALDDFKKTSGGLWVKTDQVVGVPDSLNLNRDLLFGFKKTINPAIFERMNDELDKGGTFEKVKVVKVKENVYFLTVLLNPQTGKPDGGHHRAYTRLTRGESLDVDIVEEKYMFPYICTKIKDMALERSVH